MSGAFYRQFAVTISTATVISLVLSLTLSPALAAMLLRPPMAARTRRQRRAGLRSANAGDRFNQGFERLSLGYAAAHPAAGRCAPRRMMLVYAGLIALTAGVFVWATPTGFVPQQDQGYFLAVAQLPPGASLERTDAVVREVAARILPIKGLRGAVMFAGFDGPSQTLAPNSAAAYIPLKSFAERKKLKASPTPSIMAEAQKADRRLSTRRGSCSCRRRPFRASSRPAAIG